MNRRTLLTTAVVTPLLNGCLYDRWFDLEWDEEVQLTDGRVIVVHLKQTYERLGQSFSRYGGTNLTRDTTLTFDAGGSTGRVTQLFKGFHPMFIGFYDGQWYAVLYGAYYARSRELPGQDWGELEGPYGQWAIQLDRGKWVPMSMGQLPDPFQTPNVFMLYGTASEHALFNGKTITLQDKKKWLSDHPLGYAHVRLTRPTAASPKRKASN
jgi:hypothetical protein